MHKYFYLFVSFLIASTIVIAQENPIINTPAVSPDGTMLAFNYQGDIWTSTVSGQHLKRLTIHEGYDTNPTWSPDGQTLAFQSDRFGNYDVFTISKNGGVPKRITFHSANDRVTDFTADNTILFATSRNFVQVERESEIHSVSASGGTPMRFLDAVGFDATLSPNKQFIAFTRGSCRIEREAYQGPANRDLWLYDIVNDSYEQLTTFYGQDLKPQWVDNSTIVFQSARSGVYNVHQLSIDASGKKVGEIEQISQLSSMGLWGFDLSSNGSDIIMVVGDQIQHIDRSSKTVSSVDLSIESDYRFDPIERKTFSNKATELVVSPNGKYSAFVVRGEIFVTENDKEKKQTINVSNSPYRDIDVIWQNDETLLFVSDRDGVYNLYSLSSSDSENTTIFTSLKHKITKLTTSNSGITNPVLAPNGNALVFNEGNGKLVGASISENGQLSNLKTLVEGWDSPANVSWSPDSKWIAYSLSDLYFNDEIYIQKADGADVPVNVSMHPKGDYYPTWSDDGKKLGFSSNRNNGDYDIWFIWLNKKDWEKTTEDWDESSNDTDAKKDKKSEEDEDSKIADVIIDFEDIHERQVQVTSFTGSEFLSAISKDGKSFFYYTGNGTRGNPDIESDLFKIEWDGEDKKELTKGNSSPRSISIDAKGTYLYYISKGKLNRIKIKDAKKEGLPFAAKMNIDYSEESNQIFEEAWKTIEDRFYDPAHHNRDWHQLKDIYKPLALKASNRTDFKAIFNKMLGQINASHMGMYRGEDRASKATDKTGILGLEFTDDNGALKVSSVVKHAAADRSSSKIFVGDKITAVNGIEVSTYMNIYEQLIGTANEKVILSVISNGVAKEVVIRPKSSARTDNYNAWVSERKRLTEAYSNGRLGYIHIRGMNWTSFERFERELTAAGLGKEGIVIDVRYNGGGWTTDYLMAVLNVQQHAYTVPRGAAENLEKEHTNFSNYYPYSERLPLASWTKPSIALCNQNSYSNAEIFSHAYKELELGKLVGVPTFGAVISTGGQTLIDGSYVRVPFRGWYVKSSEKNMDFTPAMPDIEVYNNPDDKAKGVDTQLKRAVDELLKTL